MGSDCFLCRLSQLPRSFMGTVRLAPASAKLPRPPALPVPPPSSLQLFKDEFQSTPLSQTSLHPFHTFGCIFSEPLTFTTPLSVARIQFSFYAPQSPLRINFGSPPRLPFVLEPNPSLSFSCHSQHGARGWAHNK